MRKQLSYIIWMLVFVVVIGYARSAHKNKKLKGSNPGKLPNDKTKSVSSDKVPNGGRQGHGSKLGSLPFPLAIAIPVIPLQGQGSNSATPNKKKKKKNKARKAETNDAENHKEYLVHSKDANHKTLKTKIVDKTLIKSNIENAESLTRFKRASNNNEDDDERSDAQIRKHMSDTLNKQYTDDDTREKRDLDITDHNLSDEERKAAETWINLDEEGRSIPDVESAYFSPSNLDFIWNGHDVLSVAYNSIIPHLKLNKRSTEDKEELNKRSSEDKNKEDDLMFINKSSEKEVELNKRDTADVDDMLSDKQDNINLMMFNAASEIERQMRPRDISPEEEEEEEEEEEIDIVNEDADFEEEQDRGTRQTAIGDEPPLTVDDALKQLQNAEQAAGALTRLETEAGIDPEHLVSNTHKYVASLQSEKAKYDADIRTHIEKAEAAEKRASIAVHDEISKKSEITHEVNAAKRQLDQDKQKIEEINTELKQLKDIELMATGLEVAKYLAKERARHNLVLAQTKASISRPTQPPPAPQVMAALPPPLPAAPLIYQAPQVTPPQQMVNNFASMRENHAPVGAVSVSSLEGRGSSQPFPSMYISPHHDVRPTYNNESPLHMPLPQYFSNYIQSKNIMENQFASSAPHTQGPSFGYNSMQSENHIGGDQRHVPARLPSSTYMVKPVLAFPAPVNYMTSFARVPKPNRVGEADHEITKIEQSHKENGHEHKDTEESRGDWGDYLSFPGTTYSPPPAWAHNPLGPNVRNQPVRTSYHYSQSPPVVQTPVASSFMHYRPLSEALTAISPDHQYSQQSLLSAPAVASYASMPARNPYTFAPPQAFESSLFPQHEIEMRPGGVSQNFARPQGVPQLQQDGTPHQEAKIGEVIKATPQDEVVTINPKPPPAPPLPEQPDLSGTLPGWMGAVDGAKFDEDVSDRLREKNESDTKQDKQKAEESTDQNVKREYLKLVNAENNFNDVNKASSAMTHIESAIGFDPGSIAKMVDFVKTAAVKDVALSKDTVDKDKQTLQKIESSSISKKSEIIKKTEIDGIALVHAREKLKTDEAVLTDAEDRLEKIKQMELIVTEVEVAKFYASNKAESEIQGAKRTIATLKRNNVAKPQ